MESPVYHIGIATTMTVTSFCHVDIDLSIYSGYRCLIVAFTAKITSINLNVGMILARLEASI